MAMVLAFWALSLLSGIARADATACPDGADRRIIAELIFGRNIGEVLGVSEDEWARFLDEEITPRFPAGLTVQDSYGQWRDTASGRIVREPGKVLTIIIGDAAAEVPLLKLVAEAYKRRFQQQSVITLTRTACVSF
jgi:hypothetical protein